MNTDFRCLLHDNHVNNIETRIALGAFMKALLKSQWIKRLEITFLTLGWASLTIAGLNIYSSIRLMMGPRSPFDQLLTAHETFLIQFKFLMGSLGDAFFAFLLSSALFMIRHQRPVESKKIDLFLKITCFSFLVEGLLGTLGWLKASKPQESFDQISYWFVYFSQLAPSLMSCLYAVTLYILFHHFFKLISFKSEVI